MSIHQARKKRARNESRLKTILTAIMEKKIMGGGTLLAISDQAQRKFGENIPKKEAEVLFLIKNTR